MAYIPPNARWYLADLIVEFQIKGDPRNVVHVNLHLIEATSPEMAYKKALALGKEGEHTFTNTNGKKVRVRFRGLKDLNVVHDPLEDGAELAYSENVSVPKTKLKKWIRPKAKLAVFARRIAKRNLPNYMPESVTERLK